MRRWRAAVVLGAGLFAGCVAGGPPLVARSTPEPAAPSSSPVASPALLGAPLILDRTDLRLGTTVQFGRVPSAGELHDLQYVAALAHVVLALPQWPRSYADLRPLEQAPAEADVIVLLPGYPPSREATEAWNLLSVRLRIVLVVEGPPPSSAAVGDLNAMRGLERVVLRTDRPSRQGFERLQRPLSFLQVMD